MLKPTFFLKGIPVVAFALILSSCQQTGQKKSSTNAVAKSPMKEATIEKAVCVLHPTEGNDVNGLVTFTKTDSGIHVVADVQGLTEGKHGFHIHQYGDCSSSDGKSAGGHFNPDNKDHGAPTSADRHVGDLGNITAGADGKAHLEMTDTLLAFQGPHSIIGRAVVVHAGEDDFVTQPTGNAGARVACGVIGIANDMMK